MQEWNNATSIARAFQIGEKEAKSVCFLQTKIDKTIVEKLRSGVRTRGMRQWLTHDVLAAEMFNVGWSSGKTGALIPWQAELTNLANNELVPWRVDCHKLKVCCRSAGDHIGNSTWKFRVFHHFFLCSGSFCGSLWCPCLVFG